MAITIQQCAQNPNQIEVVHASGQIDNYNKADISTRLGESAAYVAIIHAHTREEIMRFVYTEVDSPSAASNTLLHDALNTLFFLNNDPLQVIEAEWDFAVDGGAVGDIAMRIPGTSVQPSIPAGFCFRTYYKIITPLASGGSAVVSCGTASSPGVGIAISNIAFATLNGNTLNLGSVVETDLTLKDFSASQPVILTIGVAPLTAGKIVAWFHCHAYPG